MRDGRSNALFAPALLTRSLAQRHCEGDLEAGLGRPIGHEPVGPAAGHRRRGDGGCGRGDPPEANEIVRLVGSALLTLSESFRPGLSPHSIAQEQATCIILFHTIMALKGVS